MNIIRKLLFPFSLLYWIVTTFRNFCFDNGILKSYQFDIPIIAVGNLSVGGTGKSPQIEYLIRLLSSSYKIATLSRGYKRKSEGFVLANQNSNAEVLGDEPFQFFKKFPEILVAVDANRKNGIEQFLNSKSKPEIILLDDAFQHRKVKAGFYILLTTYDNLFVDDYVLPVGNLRESRLGVKRASVIVVTKCPNNLSDAEQQKVRNRIKYQAPIFFSCIAYDDKIYCKNDTKFVTEIVSSDILLLAGIANPKPFFEFFKNKNAEKLVFPDHHHFTDDEIAMIIEKAENKLVITTEKDYVRLLYRNIQNLYYLPIKSVFLSDGAVFDQEILNYIKSAISK